MAVEDTKKIIYTAGGFYKSYKEMISDLLGGHFRLSDPETATVMHQIPGVYVGRDLSYIRQADLLLAFQDDYPHYAGMAAEVGYATALNIPVIYIGWHSPAARDWKDSPGQSIHGTNPDGSHRLRVDQLPRQARLCLEPPAWMACPSCDDFLCTIHDDHVADCDCPPIEEWGDLNPYLPGSNTNSFLVEMAGAGLNLEHSRWLMGFPQEWADSRPTETQSSRRSRRPSSNPS